MTRTRHRRACGLTCERARRALVVGSCTTPESETFYRRTPAHALAQRGDVRDVMPAVPGVGGKQPLNRDDAPLVRDESAPPRLVRLPTALRGPPDEFRMNEPSPPLLFRERAKHPRP